MFCEQCGAVVPEGMRFCDQCGAPVEYDTAQPVQSPIMEQLPMQRGMMQPQGQPAPPPMMQPQYMNRPEMPMGRMPAMSSGAVPPPGTYNKKKSSIVPLIIAVVAILVIGLGGFGIYKNLDKIKELIGKVKKTENDSEQPAEYEPQVKVPSDIGNPDDTYEPSADDKQDHVESEKEDIENEDSFNEGSNGKRLKDEDISEKEEPEEGPGKRYPVDDEKPEKNTDRENTGDRGNDQGSKSSGSGNVTITDIVERARFKSGAPNAELDSIDPDGTLNIRLYGSGTQDTCDWYYINPSTLKGTDILGNPVNLE